MAIFDAMIKDIEFPKIDKVAIAIVQEEDDLAQPIWNVYIINQNNKPITGVLINSKGYGEIDNESKRTSVMRHFFEEIKAHAAVKVEMLPDDLIPLTNEFWVSFYLENKLYDKKYIFIANTISKQNTIDIPLLKKNGVFHP